MILLNTEFGAREIAIGVGLIVIIAIYVLVKQHFDEKKGMDSEEKKAIEALIRKIVPAGEPVTAAYATWQWTTWQGKRTTTTYWYYAIGFSDSAIYVAPLSFAGGDMSYGDSYCIRKEELGLVNADKSGTWVELYDKSRKVIVSLMVTDSNTRDDQYHPVNIQQPEETKAFREWCAKWLQEVNGANGVSVTGKIGKPIKEK